MCGRYASFRDAQALADWFALAGIDPQAEEIGASWNVAPTTRVRIVAPSGPEDPGLWLRAARWGLVPSWAKDVTIGTRMINARAETVAQKPAYRAAFARRRCIVPADGYFEWRRTGSGPSQPYWIHDTTGAPLALAGLYERWRPDPETEWLTTVTIVTAAAREPLDLVHDREPVMLPREAVAAWCDAGTGKDEARALLAAPLATDRLRLRPVSRSVNSARSAGPELIEAIGPEIDAGTGEEVEDDTGLRAEEVAGYGDDMGQATDTGTEDTAGRSTHTAPGVEDTPGRSTDTGPGVEGTPGRRSDIGAAPGSDGAPRRGTGPRPSPGRRGEGGGLRPEPDAQGTFDF